MYRYVVAAVAVQVEHAARPPESSRTRPCPLSTATAERAPRRHDVVALVGALPRAARRSRSCTGTGPTTGKTSGTLRRRVVGAVDGGGWRGVPCGPARSCRLAAADPAARPSSATRRKPRAVVRWLIGEGSGSRSKGGTLAQVARSLLLADSFRTDCARVESACREDRRLRQAGPRRDRPEAHRPGDEAARPLGRGRAQPLRRPRRRGGAAHQGGRAATARSCSSRSGPRRRSSRCARRSRWAPTGPCSSGRGRRRLRSRRRRARALAAALEREERRPRPVRPAGERLRRRRALGGRRRPAAPADDLAGRRADASPTARCAASARPSSATT